MSEERKIIDPLVPIEEEQKGINVIAIDAPDKSHEDKAYLVLIMGIDDSDALVDGSFKICYGRTACYRYIESLAEAYGEDLDVHESRVITETKQTETSTGNTKYYLIDFEDSISIYAFCKSVERFYEGSHITFKIDDHYRAPDDDMAYIPARQKMAQKEVEVRQSYLMDDVEMSKIVRQILDEKYAKEDLYLKDPLAPTEPLWKEPKPDPKKEFPDLFDEDDPNSVNV